MENTEKTHLNENNFTSFIKFLISYGLSQIKSNKSKLPLNSIALKSLEK